MPGPVSSTVMEDRQLPGDLPLDPDPRAPSLVLDQPHDRVHVFQRGELLPPLHLRFQRLHFGKVAVLGVEDRRQTEDTQPEHSQAKNHGREQLAPPHPAHGGRGKFDPEQPLPVSLQRQPFLLDLAGQLALGPASDRDDEESNERGQQEQGRTHATPADLVRGGRGKTSRFLAGAALRPAKADYIYFVSRNDGTHQFSRTLKEHNEAVEEFQRQAKAVKAEAKVQEVAQEKTPEGSK